MKMKISELVEPMELKEKEREVVRKYFNMVGLTEEEEAILEDVKSNLLFYIYG